MTPPVEAWQLVLVELEKIVIELTTQTLDGHLRVDNARLLCGLLAHMKELPLFVTMIICELDRFIARVASHRSAEISHSFQEQLLAILRQTREVMEVQMVDRAVGKTEHRCLHGLVIAHLEKAVDAYLQYDEAGFFAACHLGNLLTEVEEMSPLGWQTILVARVEACLVKIETNPEAYRQFFVSRDRYLVIALVRVLVQHRPKV